MTEWNSDVVAQRFIEAARTARRLPPVRVQGYFSVWPAFVRTEYERMAGDDPPRLRFPPWVVVQKLNGDPIHLLI